MADAEELPPDAQTVINILESMGVTDYEPRVVHQLLNFMYRYTSEVLMDAEAIASRVGVQSGEIGAQDVMLAIQNKAHHSFVPPPSMQVLASLAETCNKKPLPEIKERFGVRIPPLSDCLVNRNYEIKSSERDPPPGFTAPASNGSVQVGQGGQPYGVKQAGGDGGLVGGNVAGMDNWQPKADEPAEDWYGPAR